MSQKNKGHSSGLTVRAQRAMEHYLVNGDKRAAFLYAFGRGKSNARTLEKRIEEFWRQPKVIAEERRRREQWSVETNITQENVLRYLDEMAATRISDVMDWDGEKLTLKPFKEMTPAQRGAIESVKQKFTKVKTIDAPEGSDAPDAELVDGSIEIRMHSRLGACKLLGQHLGMFEKKQTVTLNVPAVNWIEDGDE